MLTEYCDFYLFAFDDDSTSEFIYDVFANCFKLFMYSLDFN